MCGKWISVIELGFCRYRFVEISNAIECESIASPYITIVLKCSNHICTNTENSYCAKSRVKGVYRSSGNNKRLPLNGQSNKTMCIEGM